MQVAGEERSGWVTVGLVQDNGETEFGQVIDQGDTWIFRFDYLGKHQEELETSRSELETSNWTVQVPDEFAASLREMGISPPP